MEKIIAIDPGKFDIKVASYDSQNGVRKTSFPSKLYSLKESEYFEPQGNSVFITYEGNQYIIGDQGSASDLSLKKDTILHKIGMLAGLSKFIEQGDTVHLILGCPASIYKDKNARKNYKDFMVDGNVVSFETDQRKFDVTIVSTMILPESSGAPYTYPSSFKGKRVAVLDLGGLNLNFSIYNDLILDLSSMHTANFGGYELENRIITTLSGSYGVPISHDDYIQIIKDGYITLNGEPVLNSKEVIDKIKASFAEEVGNVIKGFDYDLSLMTVIGVGGTAVLLNDALKKVYPHIQIPEDSIWANVLGFLALGREKYK